MKNLIKMKFTLFLQERKILKTEIYAFKRFCKSLFSKVCFSKLSGVVPIKLSITDVISKGKKVRI